MTFKTTERNSFKRNPVRGLHYQNTQLKPAPVVQIFFVILLIMAGVVCCKIWREKAEKNQVENHNSRRVSNVR
jgi:hypothetical protein